MSSAVYSASRVRRRRLRNCYGVEIDPNLRRRRRHGGGKPSRARRRRRSNEPTPFLHRDGLEGVVVGVPRHRRRRWFCRLGAPPLPDGLGQASKVMTGLEDVLSNDKRLVLRGQFVVVGLVLAKSGFHLISTMAFRTGQTVGRSAPIRELAGPYSPGRISNAGLAFWRGPE